MSAQSPGAYGLSALLHGGAVALVFYFAYVSHTDDDTPKVLELVAGEGNNFAATAAPALGNGGTTKLTQPAPLPVDPTPAEPAPNPAPVPPSPIQSAPETPVKPAPKPTAAAKPKATKPAKPVDLLTSLKKAEARKTARLEAAYAKKRAAEEKREAAEAKAARIDAEGIRQGVLGGSTENKTGGAGGKALTREEGSLMEAYFAELKLQMRENFTPIEGVTDNISVKVGFFVAADGAISRVRILSSSGNAEFDHAVMEACERIRMPARPDGQSDESSTRFSLREDETG